MHYPHQRRIHLMHGFHKGAIGLPPRDRVSSNRVLATLQQLNRASLRTREADGLARADTLIANSQYTVDAVECYFRAAVDHVVSPPVEVNSFDDRRPADKSFYLYLGELAAYKRVDDIVEAFAGTDHHLVVAGTGPMEADVRAASGPNVDVVGGVSERRKRELFGKCAGFVQHSLGETFGITTVEALASGAPVVAVAGGNNSYLVEDGTTGVLYDRQGGPDALRRAVERAERTEWDHDYIQVAAKRYGYDACERQWREVLADG